MEKICLGDKKGTLSCTPRRPPRKPNGRIEENSTDPRSREAVPPPETRAGADLHAEAGLSAGLFGFLNQGRLRPAARAFAPCGPFPAALAHEKNRLGGSKSRTLLAARFPTLPRLREQGALTSSGILNDVIQGCPQKPSALKGQIYQGLF